MPERIGKYEVIERIGRGGMGTVFKARDPVLERWVALKVLSSLEVTPELRARFFREAQACARLSHPNIVTIYDMGEDDGRLFIVMELLEGEELRQLIARDSPLALEDKLAIVRQICDGLHYAHQRGVVHRDIKPANILLLSTGRVKILDFGIAQVAAATQGELTRAGMIIGTLRYMAPEQVRGRADHRSDIFSVAAVSYELLSGRPPFVGEDPLQILEQIRTETPPRLSELDPALPPELAAVVERAMQREPGDRYADLGQMGGHLELVQRALAEEAERVRVRVHRRREDLEDLHKALAERTGAAHHSDPVSIPPSGEPRRLAALQALEQEIAERIQAARALLARVDALAPAMEHARQLLESGQFADAVLEFQAIVADVPEHALAIEGLAAARTRAEESRRERLAGLLVKDARSALADGAPALCLEILAQAAEIAPALLAAPEIAVLRERTEAALAAEKKAAEEARLRQRHEAEQARQAAVECRQLALAADAALRVPAEWGEAEAVVAEGDVALTCDSYAEALRQFEAAAALYRRAEDRARDALRALRMPSEATATIATPAGLGIAAPPSPSAIDRAGSTGTWRQPGDEAESRGAWVRRVRLVAIGFGAVAAIVIAILYWRPPATPPGSPVDQHATTASNAGAVRHDALEASRNRLGLARDGAAQAGAEKLAPTQFAAALRKAQEGDLALEQKDMATAERHYRDAIDAFGLARGEADRAGSLERAESEARDVESRAAEARRAAEAAGARNLAQALWAKASSTQRQAEAALRQQAFDQAQSLFANAAETYREATKAASSTSGSSTSGPSAGRIDRASLPPREYDKGQPVLEPPGARADVEQARLRMTAAKRAAEQVAAGFFAHERFTSAQSQERDGMAALGRSDYGAAVRLLTEAQSEYQAATQEARQEAERDRALAPLKASLEQAHAAVAARRQQALDAQADNLARDVFDQAQARQVEGDGLAKRQDLAAAAQAYRDATERYGEAILRARAAR